MTRPVLACGGQFELMSVLNYQPLPHPVYDSASASGSSSSESKQGSPINHMNTTTTNSGSSSSGTTVTRPVLAAAVAVYCIASTSNPVNLAQEIAKRIKLRYVMSVVCCSVM